MLRRPLLFFLPPAATTVTTTTTRSAVSLCRLVKYHHHHHHHHRFHTAPSLRARHDHHAPPFPNHYATLGVQHDASADEIKKQFYALSKRHHPDLNPADASASARFVAVSDAYHALGSADARARYDREYHAHFRHAPRSSAIPRGSFSSASAGPAGSRPASGLSRRRTQFRGPPPSFYRGGGWGEQGAKRARYQYTGQGSEPGTDGGRGGASAAGGGGGAAAAGEGGGYGPGQGEPAFDPDIPHWDREAHRRTHEGLQGRRESASRAYAEALREREALRDGAGVAASFFTVIGVMLIGMAVGSTFWSSKSKQRIDKPRREDPPSSR